MDSDNRYELRLDSSQFEPWEIAARLDMLLAYPNAKPARMQRLVNAACADQISVTLEASPHLRDELREKYPDYDPKIRVERKNIGNNRQIGLKVGAVVLTLVKETATGAAPLLPKSCASASLDNIIGFLWHQKLGTDDGHYLDRLHDIEARQVRARYPIAHLAAAYQWIARMKADAGQPPTYDYQDLVFLRSLISKAHEIAGYIRNTPQLKGMARKLINIKLIGP